MFSMKRFVAVGAIAATLTAYFVLQPCSAKADDEGGILGDIAISQVAATPARAGETTVVTFSVENAGSERILITGLRMPGGEPARIMGSLGQGQGVELGTLPVRADATEHLDGKKLWIEVGPLARDLEPDSTIPARLVLGTYESPLALHVGPIATGSTRTTAAGAANVADRPSAAALRGTGC
ncbi:hypothetical protein ACFOYU_10100 [Microvirga sp. GCM10011540]|uniref:hypothetical protein n=1 Tax=Microvirga sp. GCM10011540 TaxID=3317338 RepID=UPI00360F9B48